MRKREYKHLGKHPSFPPPFRGSVQTERSSLLPLIAAAPHARSFPLPPGRGGCVGVCVMASPSRSLLVFLGAGVGRSRPAVPSGCPRSSAAHPGAAASAGGHPSAFAASAARPLSLAAAARSRCCGSWAPLIGWRRLWRARRCWRGRAGRHRLPAARGGLLTAHPEAPAAQALPLRFILYSGFSNASRFFPVINSGAINNGSTMAFGLKHD